MRLKTIKDFKKLSPALLVWDMLKKEAIKWIKAIESLKYGERFCLKCKKVINTGQYCHRKEHRGEQRFVEQQTGSSGGAVQMLEEFHNITKRNLK